jgi:hypothetical protein
MTRGPLAGWVAQEQEVPSRFAGLIMFDAGKFIMMTGVSQFGTGFAMAGCISSVIDAANPKDRT